MEIEIVKTWRRLPFLFFLSSVLVGLLACTQGQTEETSEVSAPVRQARPAAAAVPSSASVAQPAPAPRPSQRETPLVVFLGDSLTAGYGLNGDQAYPVLLERRLAGKGMPVRVINAGVSGDTTAGGLARLDWLLRQKPDVLVVGLGGNDGLRGLDLEQTEENLRQIVRRGKGAGAQILLLGMKIPPNYGPEYTSRFEAMYTEIASEMDVPLVPFLLEGVGGVAELNQADAIHPTARGQEILADNVEPYLRGMLEEGVVSGAAANASR